MQDQKPATTQEEEKTDQLTTQNPSNIINNDQIEDKKSTSITKSTDQLAFIKNKRAYNAFKRLVKKGKFTSARATAQALGVSHQTIIAWSNQKAILDIMATEVDTFVDKIASSQDWKAQQYLLERISPTIKEETSTNVAIQINLPSLQDSNGATLNL